MFSNSEKFALIKSTPQVLIGDLMKIFKDDTDFIIQELVPSSLDNEILSISKSKYDNNKFVIWKPEGLENYSVFYSNYLDGWYSLISILNVKYKRDVILAYLGLIENKGTVGFYYYYEGKERIVRALYDDTKWTFFERGEILPFEKEEYYNKRKIVDRMNNDIMIEYFLRLGFNINEENFYKSSVPFILGKRI